MFGRSRAARNSAIINNPFKNYYNDLVPFALSLLLPKEIINYPLTTIPHISKLLTINYSLLIKIPYPCQTLAANTTSSASLNASHRIPQSIVHTAVGNTKFP